ncbi:MAG TPA: hypothetical protein VL418_04175 [Devosiaceae bacterium]|nr:hypothetical protein [Devosiaceae bacterium]
MSVVADRFEDLQPVARATNWRGRSGRFYALDTVALDRFVLNDSGMYLLAAGGLVLWVGTADEVVNDAATRTRFRAALDEAEIAFRIAAPEHEIERMTLAWDLEGAEPVLGLNLA